ncbi:MAG: methylmalonyl-CoA mutase family protein [Planctomycetota bacterium]
MSERAWPQQSVDSWREVARAELDGGDPDALACPLGEGVEMRPLFTRADMPADLAPPQPEHPDVAPTRVAMVANDAASAAASTAEALGHDLVRIAARGLQTSLANGETEDVRRLDPDRVALTLAATPEGMAALATLERAGLPHAVVLDIVEEETAAAPADELAASLCVLVQVLRGLGLSPAPRPSALAARLYLPLRLGTDLVTQVAKVRAARWLFHTVTSAFEVDLERRHARVWAIASRRCWSAIDPELNLARATLQAFAAVAGGCEVFEPLLFDPVAALDESRRLAANQHRLLVHEADLTRVHDPLAGSYAVESLTAQIANGAWSRLQAWARDGHLPAPEPAPASTLVGTNRFADPAARVTLAPEAPSARPAASFEHLRRRSAERPVAAVLVPFGEPTTARPRIDWAADLLRTAGIEPDEAPPCSTAEAVQAELARRTDARIVVLCGLDDRDGTLVRGVAATLAGNPRPLLYATGEPPRGSEAWGAIGFLHRGLDTASTLHGVLDRLATTDGPA